MIVTTDEFKTYAGIDTDDDDEAIDLVLAGAIGWCESVCSNRFEQKNCAELFDGESEELFLENTLNILEVKIEQFMESGWTELDSSMFTVYTEEGLVKLKNVTGGDLNYRVSYKAGYVDDLPNDLKLIILKITGRMWNKRKSDGVKDERLGDAEVIWDDVAGDDVMRVLNKYRKYNL